MDFIQSLKRIRIILKASGVLRSAFTGLFAMIVVNLILHHLPLFLRNEEEIIYKAFEEEFWYGSNLTFNLLIFSVMFHTLFFSTKQHQRDFNLILQPIWPSLIHISRLLLIGTLSSVYLLYFFTFYELLGSEFNNTDISNLGSSFGLVYLLCFVLVISIGLSISILPLDDIQKGTLLLVLVFLLTSPPSGPSTSVSFFFFPLVIDLLPQELVEVIELAYGDNISQSFTSTLLTLFFLSVSIFLFYKYARLNEKVN